MAARHPVILLLIAAVCALPLLMLARCRGNPAEDGTVEVVIKGRPFTLEVSASAEAITQGLMHRETIPDGAGMIFIFPDAQMRGFWMKNCLTDIDLIFLDSRGYVTATHRMVTEPPQREDESLAAYEARLQRYSSAWPAQFAIELPPGSLDQLNVRFEDKIDLDLEALKALVH